MTKNKPSGILVSNTEWSPELVAEMERILKEKRGKPAIYLPVPKNPFKFKMMVWNIVASVAIATLLLAVNASLISVFLIGCAVGTGLILTWT